MVIAVASGKGGTGKTTLTVALAQALDAAEQGPILVSDCDVEAPNLHLYLNPDFSEQDAVDQQIPSVDGERCNGCGICAEVCRYHAVLVVKGKATVFPSLCHGCGSCTLQCPEGALEEIPRQIGILDRGTAGKDLYVRQGRLRAGEPLAVPVIRALKGWHFPGILAVELIDSPPGASCPVVEAVRQADFLLLVTEPTPFGLHDLRAAVQVGRELGIRMGVVINRAGIGQEDIRGYCGREGIPVYLEIPLDREIGAGLAGGRSLLEIRPDYQEAFLSLWQEIRGAVGAAEYD